MPIAYPSVNATWPIRLNDPCSAVMWAVAITITAATCYYCYDYYQLQHEVCVCNSVDEIRWRQTTCLAGIDQVCFSTGV